MKIANIVERIGIGIKNGEEDLTSCKGRTHIPLDSKEEGRDESRSVVLCRKCWRVSCLEKRKDC